MTTCQKMEGNLSKVSPSKPKTHFQLYNSSHKSELVKLLEGIKPFKLDCNKDATEGEETKESSYIEFQDLSEHLDNSYATPDDLILNLNLNYGSGLTCTTCEISFPDIQEQRLHFRLDWHRYNVKRRFYSQKPVDDIQFDEMMDELSSISGSENDESESVVSKVQVSRLLNKVEEGANDEKIKKDGKESKPKHKVIGSPKIFFENFEGNILAIYKAAVPSMVNNINPQKPESYLNELLTKPPIWGIVLVSSGHFAGAVFEGGKEIIHKTFHSYTVRAKQGGAESSSGLHKSAGSNLRRHNEASLFQNIQDLLELWKPQLASCQIIFYRMGNANQNVLFAGKHPPLNKSDSRLRTIPFPTKRPTFSEVKNVLKLLTSIQVYSKDVFLAQFVKTKNENSSMDDILPAKAKSKPKRKNIDRDKSRSPPEREIPGQHIVLLEESSGNEDEVAFIEVEQEIDFTELQEFGDSLTPDERERRRPRRKKVKIPKPLFQKPGGFLGELLELLDTKNPLFVERLKQEFDKTTNYDETINLLTELNQPVDEERSTLLHISTKSTQLDAIWCLLESGFEPTIKDKLGKYAYNCAETKECRNIFRRFRAQYPEKYDYHKSQIPDPLTKEMEQEKAEKKRILNKLKREKEKQMKMEMKEKQTEIDEKERFLNLSDREKRALAAERRKLLECKKSGDKVLILNRIPEGSCRPQQLTGSEPGAVGYFLSCPIPGRGLNHRMVKAFSTLAVTNTKECVGSEDDTWYCVVGLFEQLRSKVIG